MKKPMILITLASLITFSGVAKADKWDGIGDAIEASGEMTYVGYGAAIGSLVGVGVGGTIASANASLPVSALISLPIGGATVGATIGVISVELYFSAMRSETYLGESIKSISGRNYYDRQVFADMQSDAVGFLKNGDDASPLLQSGIEAIRKVVSDKQLDTDLSDKALALAIIQAKI